MTEFKTNAPLAPGDVLLKQDIPETLLPDELATAEPRRIVEFDSHKLNFGPQHPSAHGVLRLVLEIEWDVVAR